MHPSRGFLSYFRGEILYLGAKFGSFSVSVLVKSLKFYAFGLVCAPLRGVVLGMKRLDVL